MSTHKDQESRQTGRRFSKTAAILTISDKGARGEREDRSGSILLERLSKEGYEVLYQVVIPDEVDVIGSELIRCAEEKRVALVVTTGGTGVAPRDVTPEATLAVVDRTVPGMAEAMRTASLAKTPHAMISRAIVGIRGKTLIVNLPGSPKGALENLDAILSALPHALNKIQGDPSDCAASD